MKATVRVDLRDHRTFGTEVEDEDLYAAIRSGATDSARVADRQLECSPKVTRQRPEVPLAFDHYSPANI